MVPIGKHILSLGIRSIVLNFVCILVIYNKIKNTFITFDCQSWDDKISIMSNVIGMILWYAVIVIISPRYILISDVNLAGGYILIFLIYFISRSRLAEKQRSKEFTFNFFILLIMIFNHIAGLLMPYIFPK